MPSFIYRMTAFGSGALVAALIAAGPGCGGGTGAGNPVLTVQSAPLAGPNAAAVDRPPLNLADLFDFLAGVREALASVSSFAVFKACNDTLIFVDSNGQQLNINGTTNPSVGQGLLTFSPTATTAATIGTVSIAPGTVLSEIDITFAVVPSACQGTNYAVEFNDGTHGTIDITQNTAFKFKFASPGRTVASGSDTVTLKFGQIVNGMVSLGAGLNNNTIQTVNVGQAQ